MHACYCHFLWSQNVNISRPIWPAAHESSPSICEYHAHRYPDRAQSARLKPSERIPNETESCLLCIPPGSGADDLHRPQLSATVRTYIIQSTTSTAVSHDQLTKPCPGSSPRFHSVIDHSSSRSSSSTAASMHCTYRINFCTDMY